MTSHDIADIAIVNSFGTVNLTNISFTKYIASKPGPDKNVVFMRLEMNGIPNVVFITEMDENVFRAHLATFITSTKFAAACNVVQVYHAMKAHFG